MLIICYEQTYPEVRVFMQLW